MEDMIIEESDKPLLGGTQPVIPPNLYSIMLMNIMAWGPLTYLHRFKKPAIFGVLFLLILTMNLYLSLTLPFLTEEIVNNRKQRAILGGILAGTYPFVLAVTSLIAGSLASKTTGKKMVGWSGAALFLSSIVFVIPMSNNVFFGVLVVISR